MLAHSTCEPDGGGLLAIPAASILNCPQNLKIIQKSHEHENPSCRKTSSTTKEIAH